MLQEDNDGGGGHTDPTDCRSCVRELANSQVVNLEAECGVKRSRDFG